MISVKFLVFWKINLERYFQAESLKDLNNSIQNLCFELQTFTKTPLVIKARFLYGQIIWTFTVACCILLVFGESWFDLAAHFLDLYFKINMQFICLIYLMYVNIIHCSLNELISFHRKRYNSILVREDLLKLIHGTMILYKKINSCTRLINQTFSSSLTVIYLFYTLHFILQSYYLLIKLTKLSNIVNGTGGNFIFMGKNKSVLNLGVHGMI